MYFTRFQDETPTGRKLSANSACGHSGAHLEAPTKEQTGFLHVADPFAAEIADYAARSQGIPVI